LDIQEFERSFSNNLKELMPQILERAARIGHVDLGDIDFDLWQAYTDTSYSFILGFFAATVFFASRAVEMAINKDARMQDERMKSERKWLSLNRRVLKEARIMGLPADLLLDSDEVKLENDPLFIVRRNKVVHGDTEGYKDATGFYKVTDFTKSYRLPVAPSEEDAYDQLVKSRRFMIGWTRLGSPHVPKNARTAKWEEVT